MKVNISENFRSKNSLLSGDIFLTWNLIIKACAPVILVAFLIFIFIYNIENESRNTISFHVNVSNLNI